MTKTSIGLLGLLFVSSLLASCGKTNAAADHSTNTDTVWVTAAAPEIKMMARTVTASGLLSTPTEAVLSFKTPGLIESMSAEEGRFVKKGTQLATLNLTEINAMHSQARIACEKAQRDLDRVKKLYADSVATFEQLQNAQSAFDAAKASLEQARFNVDHSRICAPVDGYILHTFAHAGEMSGAGLPIVLFGHSSDGEWAVTVGATDREVVQLSLSDKATITVDAYPNVQFQGAVTEIASFPDKNTGAYPVKIHFNAHGHKLAVGFSAKVKILPSAAARRVLVPIDALTELDHMQASIWGLEEATGTARKVPVTVDYIDGATAVLSMPDTSSVRSTMRLVTSGQNKIYPHSVVRIQQ
ncbi:MAG TPA: efflux RND transporter periplasmic adaptor subunit [Bacteroidota bacterium]|nr:efflux RND transporter periplasmic adaptor subunit [Bacteroidota bacterium]